MSMGQVFLKRDGILIEGNNIQEFEGLHFKTKLETLPNEDNVGRLCFLNFNNEEIPVPVGLICKDVTNNNEIVKAPLPFTQMFLISNNQKYRVFYNEVKILQINSEKKFVIHNFIKTERVKKEAEIKKEKRLEKHLDSLIIKEEK